MMDNMETILNDENFIVTYDYYEDAGNVTNLDTEVDYDEDEQEMFKLDGNFITNRYFIKLFCLHS